MPDLKFKLFCNQVYHLLGNAKDAVFERKDAAIFTSHPNSLAELSLSPVFPRQWPSTQEALEDCHPSPEKLMEVYIKQIPKNQRPLLVGDHSGWLRPDAVTLQQRTDEKLSLIRLQQLDTPKSKPLWLAWHGE